MNSGHQWEFEVFEYSSLDGEFAKAEHFGKYEFALAMNGQEERYGWDPAKPKTRIALNLFESIQSYLVQLGKNPKSLRMYCTLGTGLDRWGIDGFFEHEGSIVTFDLTSNPNKPISKREVHVIFYRQHRGPTLLHGIAKKVASVLAARNLEIYATG